MSREKTEQNFVHKHNFNKFKCTVATFGKQHREDTTLVKNKGGDLSDVDNWRAIMVSNAISKVFEFVLLDRVMTGDEYLALKPNIVLGFALAL